MLLMKLEKLWDKPMILDYGFEQWLFHGQVQLICEISYSLSYYNQLSRSVLSPSLPSVSVVSFFVPYLEACFLLLILLSFLHLVFILHSTNPCTVKIKSLTSHQVVPPLPLLPSHPKKENLQKCLLVRKLFASKALGANIVKAALQKSWRNLRSFHAKAEKNHILPLYL